MYVMLTTKDLHLQRCYTNRSWRCAATCCTSESLTKCQLEHRKFYIIHSHLTGLKKLKKESCGTSLVMVLTVPLPLCFCFFLILFTVTSLPFCQSILQLEKNQEKKVCTTLSAYFHPVNLYSEDKTSQPSSLFIQILVTLLLTPHSPLSLAPRMRKGQQNLAPISFCMF